MLELFVYLLETYLFSISSNPTKHLYLMLLKKKVIINYKMKVEYIHYITLEYIHPFR